MGKKWWEKPRNVTNLDTLSKEDILAINLKRVKSPKEIVKGIIKRRLPLMQNVSKIFISTPNNNWVLKHFEECQNYKKSLETMEDTTSSLPKQNNSEK